MPVRWCVCERMLFRAPGVCVSQVSHHVLQSPNAGATRSPSPATVSLESAMLILKARWLALRSPGPQHSTSNRQFRLSSVTQGTRPSSADRTQRRTWSPSPADARQVSATPMRDASPSATALLRRPTSASAALLSRPRLSSPSPPPVSRVYGLRAAAAVSPSVERPHTGGAVPLRRATTVSTFRHGRMASLHSASRTLDASSCHSCLVSRRGRVRLAT